MNATRKTLTIFGDPVHVTISARPDAEGLYTCEFDRQRNYTDSRSDLITRGCGVDADVAVKNYVRSCYALASR